MHKEINAQIKIAAGHGLTGLTKKAKLAVTNDPKDYNIEIKISKKISLVVDKRELQSMLEVKPK